MTLTPKQLQEHNSGLGGSDALAYCGRDPRCSLTELYRRKTAPSALPETAPANQLDGRREWGSRLEPVVRDWLAEQLAKPIHSPPTLHHPQLPWMIGHLDGVTEAPAEGVEIKTADRFLAEEFGELGTDQVPVRYVLQVTHYMLISGLRRFHLAALIGGNDARHYVIDYDAKLAALLIAKARAFWACIESRTPPPPSTLADADWLWPSSSEHIVKANEATLTAVAELTRLRGEESRAARAADELEVQVKAYMGNAAILANARGQKLLTWRQQERTHFDFQAFSASHAELAAQYRTSRSFRVFRLK